jgi:hypothetical protein
MKKQKSNNRRNKKIKLGIASLGFAFSVKKPFILVVSRNIPISWTRN